MVILRWRVPALSSRFFEHLTKMKTNSFRKTVLSLASSLFVLSFAAGAHALDLHVTVDDPVYTKITEKHKNNELHLKNFLDNPQALSNSGNSLTISGKDDTDWMNSATVVVADHVTTAVNNKLTLNQIASASFSRIAKIESEGNLRFANNSAKLNKTNLYTFDGLSLEAEKAGKYEISNNTIEMADSYVYGQGKIANIGAKTTGAKYIFSDNSLHLKDSKNQQKIIGVEIDATQDSHDNILEVHGNTLTVENADLRDLAVYLVISNRAPDTFKINASNNTIHASKNVFASTLSNFDRLTLSFDEANQAADHPVLTLDPAQSYLRMALWDPFDTSLDLKGKELKVDAQSVNPGTYHLIVMKPTEVSEERIKVDDKTSFVAAGLFTDTKWENIVPQELDGTALDIAVTAGSGCQGQLMLDGKPITACAKTVANKNASTLSYSVLASHAFMSQAVEFVADEGLFTAMNTERIDGKGTLFGVVNGGVSRYSSSHLDMNAMHFLIGGTQTVALNEDRLTTVGFFETGRGLSQTRVDGGSGDGRDTYYGVGAAARYLLDSGLYADGGLHVGYHTAKFEGKYEAGAASYERDGFYLGGHVAGGYLWELNEGLRLDLYARYSVMHTGSDSVELDGTEKNRFAFKATTTQSVRTGFRVAKEFEPNMVGRMGLAYEHIFGGTAKTMVNSVTLDEASLSGNNGILDLGLSFTPDARKGGFGLDLGLKGYVGARRGLSGNVQVRYDF